jgi:hypothetical protein
MKDDLVQDRVPWADIILRWSLRSARKLRTERRGTGSRTGRNMIIAHKSALDPNAAQESYFACACGTARFAGNWAGGRYHWL